MGKVGQLAEALVGLTGLTVSAAQATNINLLCDALDNYDKGYRGVPQITPATSEGSLL